MFESRRRHDSNTKPSNINQHNVVAPTGHDTFCILEFRGVIRVA